MLLILDWCWGHSLFYTTPHKHAYTNKLARTDIEMFCCHRLYFLTETLANNFQPMRDTGGRTEACEHVETRRNVSHHASGLLHWVPHDDGHQIGDILDKVLGHARLCVQQGHTDVYAGGRQRAESNRAPAWPDERTAASGWEPHSANVLKGTEPTCTNPLAIVSS